MSYDTKHRLPVAGVESVPSVYHHESPILSRLVQLPKEAVGMDGTIDAARETSAELVLAGRDGSLTLCDV